MDEKDKARGKILWWRRVTRPPRAPESETQEEEHQSLEEWQDLVEQRIQEAMKRGDFDDLSTKGKPLNLDWNPFADPAWEMAHSLLQGQGFTLQWIEERRLIEVEIQQARDRLHRAWHWTMRRTEILNARDPDDPEVQKKRAWVEAEWERHLDDFRAAVADLNRRIDDYNLTVPLVRFQMFRLRLHEELRNLGISPQEEG